MVDDHRIEALLEEIMDSGRSPEEVCRACPELLPALQERLQRLRAFEGELAVIFPTQSLVGLDGTPLDREVPDIPGYVVENLLGRGGMGVVYKARHLKLTRTVAIKMLLTGAYAAPPELARFVREAQAIAVLRHPNIIQVFDVGDVEGRPYFTMEFLEGGSLSQKLAGAPQRGREAATMVATLADAIEVAHAAGIVHRDLKPANILLTADGTPKISDFGLARTYTEAPDLTLGGTRLGTPSYMSPEQAIGSQGTIGPSTDIYSLGAVLYEMLTGRPPFKAETPAETERQVIAEDPAPPSRLNAKVPRDLETICLKCLSKDPKRRYATASDLADDLRRFLRGEPISARRAGPLERLGKWVRRHPTQSTLIGVVTLCMVVLVLFAIWSSASRTATVQAVGRDLDDVVQRERRWDWAGARAMLEIAKTRLGDTRVRSLDERVEQLESDLELVAQLEKIRDARAIEVDFQLGPQAVLAQADRDYAEAIQTARIGAPLDDPEVVANRVRKSSVASALVAALDDWAVCVTDEARLIWLLDVATRADADADEWRGRVRDRSSWGNLETLKQLAASAAVESQSVHLLTVLAERVRAAKGDDIPLLMRVQEAHPDDYLANGSLGNSLLSRKSFDRAARYLQAAVALRPDSAIARNNLAVAMARSGQLDAAMTQFRAILRTDPDFAFAYQGLANCHLTRREYADAIELCRSAVRLQPNSHLVHTNLGVMLSGMDRIEEAREQFQTALKLKPDYALAHCGLGGLANKSGQFAEGAEHYREALRRDPSVTEGRIGLSESLREMGQLDESLTVLQQATTLAPDNARVHLSLGLSLLYLARMQESIDELQMAARIDSTLAPAYGALTDALIIVGRYHEGAVAAEKALGLLPANDSLRPQLNDYLRICQEKFNVEDHWPAVVSGNDVPTDPAECLDLANIGYHRKHFATAARMFEIAFAAEPRIIDDLGMPYLSNAACVAALAGCGRGEDGPRLSDADKAKWRHQARQWVQAISVRLKEAAGKSRVSREDALNRLSHLQSDPDLAGIRDNPAIADLPPSEIEECRAVWTEVADLMEHLRNSS